MIFCIIIIIIGITILYQDNTFITTGYNSTTIYNYTIDTASSITQPIRTEFDFEWMLYLAYISLLLQAIVQLTTGEEYNRYKRG